MTTYGYCRKSRAKQNIERQIRNIKQEYPQAIIVQEAFTGTTMDRREWNKLFKTVQAADTIVFDSVSRMSRNAEEGYTAYEELFEKGVELVFLKEPHINTATFKGVLEHSVPLTGTNVDFILEGINKYLLALAKEQIRSAFEQSQKEVDDLHQRTNQNFSKIFDCADGTRNGYIYRKIYFKNKNLNSLKMLSQNEIPIQGHRGLSLGGLFTYIHNNKKED